jgi:hypothetical protein
VSNYLKQIIVGGEIGNCDYCNSKDINVYNPSELSKFFVVLIDLYEEDDEGKDIAEQLIDDFPNKIFTERVISKNSAKKLLMDILEDDFDNYKGVLEAPVKLKLNKTSYQSDIVEPLAISWDEFCKEIKNVNRFHFQNVLDLGKLKSIFEKYKKEIVRGKSFYRSRISKGPVAYSKAEMKNPPAALSTNGRANPNGISYLYLSDSEKTTLYEIRASLYDYVSVARFRLNEDIQVVNLSFLSIDIFAYADEDMLEDILIYKDFILKLEDELSKPHRRHDSDLDYLPTQYVSEFIKSMGFDGIEYKSSLYPEGYNLAIFNTEKFECKKVELYDIKTIDLTFENIS